MAIRHGRCGLAALLLLLAAVAVAVPGARAQFRLTIDAAEVVSAGDAVAAAVTVTPVPPDTRFVTVADDTGVQCDVEMFAVTDDTASGSCTLAPLPSGVRTVSAVLSPSLGDAIPASVIVSVTPLAVFINVTSVPNPSDYGVVDVDVEVYSSAFDLVPSGTITVFDGFVSLASAELVFGSASVSLDLALPPTSFVFDVVYTPDDELFPPLTVYHTHAVEVTVEVDAVFNSVSAVRSPELDMSFTLSSPDSGRVPKGVVEIEYDGQPLCTVRTFDGTGACRAGLVTFQPHVDFVVLRYGGEDNIHPATEFELPFLWTPAIVPLTLATPYVDNFEQPEAFWFPDNNGRSNWELGVPDPEVMGAAASGTVAWATDLNGFYENNLDSQLFSPVFDLSLVSAPVTVGFQLNYDLEAARDSLTLEMKLGSRPWLRVGSAGDPINWYNDPRNSWSDTSDGFVQVWHDISGAAGQRSVQFRLRLVTDGTEREPGALFDDFTLSRGRPTQVRLESSASTRNTIGVRVDSLQAAPAAGTVRVQDPSAGSCTVTLNGGDGQCNLNVLTPGVKNLLLSYQPSDINDASSSTEPFGRLSTVTLSDRAFVRDEFDGSLFSLPLLWYVESGIWERGVPAGGVIFGAASRPNAWVTNLNGPYPLQGESHVLLSGIFDGRTTNDEVYFSADVWYDLAFGDVVRLSMSRNGGASFVTAHEFRAGRSDGWERFNLKLSNADGVQLQFRLELRPSVSSGADPDGFAIDNIQISAESRPVELEHNLPSVLLLRKQQAARVRFSSPFPPSPLVDDTPQGTVSLFGNGLQTTCNSAPLQADGSAECTFVFNSGGSKEVEVRFVDASRVHADTVFYHTVQVADTAVLFDGSYFDDFEATFDPLRNWVPRGVPVWELGSDAASGMNAWTTDKDGLHDDSLDVSVVSPVFDFNALDDGSPVAVSAHIKYSLSAGDSVVLEYATFDDGLDPVRWTPVTASPGAIGWYAGSGGWAGEQAEYATAVTKIDVGGRWAQFRFRLSADAEGKGFGFSFDDFAIVTGQVTIDAAFDGEQTGATSGVRIQFTIGSTLFDLSSIAPAGSVEVSQGGEVLCITGPLDADFSASCTAAGDTLSGEPMLATFVPTDDFHGTLTREIAYPFVEVYEPLLPFKDTFELAGIVPAWRSAGLWEFGFLNSDALEGAASGTSVWATDLDAEYESGVYFVYSPVFDCTAFPTDRAVYFGAAIAYALEDGFDFVVVQADVDVTGSFSTIGVPGPVNWYTNAGNGTWTGRTQGFVNAYQELDVAGHFVQLRFVLVSDASVFLDGFAFDDIELTTRTPLQMVSEQQNSAPVSVGDTVAVDAQQVSLNGAVFEGWARFTSDRDGVVCDAVLLDAAGAATCQFAPQQAGFHRIEIEFIPNPPIAGDVISVPGYASVGVSARVVFSTVSELPYFDDFEDETAAVWTPSGSPSTWFFGRPAGGLVIDSAASGINAWSTVQPGGHRPFLLAYLNSPVFDLTAVPATEQVFASFRIWFSSEAPLDGTFLEMSTDGGATFSLVGALGDHINWYNEAAFSVELWSGESRGYVLAEHELPGAAGAVVQLRFVFVSDDFFNDDGVAIDDFGLFTANPSLVEATVVPEAQTGSIERVVVDVSSPFHPGPAPEGRIVARSPAGECTATLVDGHGECLLDLITLLNELVYIEVEFIPDDRSAVQGSTVSVPVVVHVTVRIDEDDFPYTDNFEGESLWVSDDPSTWQLGNPEGLGTSSGDNAWATNLDGLYPNARYATLTSPVFDLTGISPELSIFFSANINYNTEEDFDGVILLMSLDDGDYVKVGAGGDLINWYEEGGQPDLHDGPGFWNGDSQGYRRAVHLLPNAPEHFVQLRMLFASDGAVRDVGFAFDDIIISTGLRVDVDVLYTVPDPAVVGVPVELGFQVQSNNLLQAVVDFAGVVTVLVDTSEACVASFSAVDGRGSCDITFDSPGDNEIQFILNGPTFFERFVITRTLRVNRSPTAVTIVSVNGEAGPAIAGLPVVVEFEVESAVASEPFGSVTIADESGAACQGVLDTDARGSCTLVIEQAGAANELVASYTGDFIHAPSVVSEFITVSPRLAISADVLPLVDTFEDGTTWYRDVRADVEPLWELGVPEGDVIVGAASGMNAWATDLDQFHRADELDYVYSPAYDTGGIPIGADLVWCADAWYSMSFRTGDGAFLEISADRGEWIKVGVAGEVQWYTDPEADVWNRESGGYVQVCHPLPEAVSADVVQLRIGFVVNEEQVESGDGFAFDNARVQLSAPTVVQEVRPEAVPIPFGQSDVSFEVTVLSVAPGVPQGRGELELAVPGLQCNRSLDNAGQFRCSFAVTDPRARLADVRFFARNSPYDEDSAASFVLPIEYSVERAFSASSGDAAYRDDFEELTAVGNWWARDARVWQQGESPVLGASSGSSAWVTFRRGVYESSLDSSVYSPRFDLTRSLVDLQLYVSQQVRYSLAAGDRVVLEVNIDDGSGWQQLSGLTYNLPSTGWTGFAERFAPAYGELPAGTALSDDVQFRFRLLTDEDAIGLGFAFDDFELTPLPPVAIEWDFANSVVQDEEFLVRAGVSSPFIDDAIFKGTIVVSAAGEQLCTIPVEGVTPSGGCNITLSTNVTQVLQLEFTFQDNANPLLAQVVHQSGVVFRSEPFSVTEVVALTPEADVYSDSFEGGDERLWASDGLWADGEPRGRVIDEAFDGNRTWATDLRFPHDPAVRSSLFSPVFDATLLTEEVYMSAWIWYDMAAADGRVYVEQSLNGGEWELVGVDGDTINWYNSAAPDGWGGRSGGWVFVQHLLPGAVGQRVQVRFVSVGSGTEFFDGFAVDLFAVGDLPLPTRVRVNDDNPSRSAHQELVTFYFDTSNLLEPDRAPEGIVSVWSDLDQFPLCSAPANVFSGYGVCTTDDIVAPGTHRLSATFVPLDGDDTFGASTVTAEEQLAERDILPVHVKAGTEPVVSFVGVNPSPSAVDRVVELTLYVHVPLDGSTPAGEVVVTDSASNQTCTAVLSFGTGTCYIAFARGGSRTLTASFTARGEDDVSAVATVEHLVRATTTDVAFVFPSPSFPGTEVQFDSVVQSLDGAVVSGAVVVFDETEFVTCVSGVFDGESSCSMTLNVVGEHRLTVSYVSLGLDAPASSTSFVHVVDAERASYSQIVITPSEVVVSLAPVVTVQVYANDRTPPQGTVSVFVEGEINCRDIPVQAGDPFATASCRVDAAFEEGTRSVRAVYSSTNGLPGSTAEASYDVVAPATTITAASSPNPSRFPGQTVVSGVVHTNTEWPFTADVLVTDTVGDAACFALVHQDGTFSCRLTLLNPGLRVLSARYPGDEVNVEASVTFEHFANATRSGPTPTPTPIPTATPVPDPNNGPTVAAAQTHAGAQLIQVFGASPNRLKRGVEENNEFRRLVRDILGLVSTQRVGVDDVLQDPFFAVLIPDQGRNGDQLADELQVLVDVRADSVRNTFLDGASIVIVLPPVQPSPPSPAVVVEPSLSSSSRDPAPSPPAPSVIFLPLTVSPAAAVAPALGLLASALAVLIALY